MAQKVELRKRSGNSFSGNDNLILPVTHVNFVLGLLDENSKKLNVSLLPDSVLSAKRMAGSINGGTDFATMYTRIKDFNENNERLYAGTYFISNGNQYISASTDHVIYYNDDSRPASTTVQLESGDHLFYVKYGGEYMWDDTGTTLDIPAGDGVADLPEPYMNVSSTRVFATESEIIEYNPVSSAGRYALITGYKWVETTQNEYNAAGYKITKISPIGGSDSELDADAVAVPTKNLWEAGLGSVVLIIETSTPEVAPSYWKLTKVDETFEGDTKVYAPIIFSNKHIWGVVNNSYGLATSTSSGLMSSLDKVKLNSLSNYEHPDHIKQDIELSGVQVITGFESDSLGHVKSVSTGTLRSASTDSVGVVELATVSEGQNATDSSRALTPASGLAMLKHRQDVSYFGSVTAANDADLPNGATAIIVTGNITI